MSSSSTFGGIVIEGFFSILFLDSKAAFFSPLQDEIIVFWIFLASATHSFEAKFTPIKIKLNWINFILLKKKKIFS